MIERRRKTGRRIGLLHEGNDCSLFVHEVIKSLEELDAELYLLRNVINRPRGVLKVIDKLAKVGFYRLLSIIVFNLWERIEVKLTLWLKPQLKHCLKQKKLCNKEFVRVLELYPVLLANNRVKYPASELGKIADLDLDIIIRGQGGGIYTGDILTIAKDGIISFHHGDNSWNRGGPPGFWEVYKRVAGTGFIIQILNEKLDAGSVIFKGEIPTQSTYILNQTELLCASNPYFIRLIRKYINTGLLPSSISKNDSLGPILKTPSIGVTLQYLLYLFLTTMRYTIRRRFLGKQSRWYTGISSNQWGKICIDDSEIVPNERSRFFADPFVIKCDEKNVVFVEDYCFKKKRGVITAINISDENNIIENVISENFHLSFPYVFEFQDSIYMTPESVENRSIRLYRCLVFPHQWVYVKNILCDIRAVDSLIFFWGDRWWLLSNVSLSKYAKCGSALFAYHSDDPISGLWTEHEGNPIQFSAAYGRNGGLLRDHNGSIYRVRQRYEFGRYGAGVTVAKIVRLTPSEYEEESVFEVESSELNGYEGLHHMHCNLEYTVFDINRDDRGG